MQDPYTLYCIIYSWLKEFKIELASERKQRKMAKEIIGDNLQAEKAPFTFSKDGGGEEIREVPFVFVPNLIQKVADLVAHNERYIHNTRIKCTIFTSTTF